jgi:LCP family protein required for cell wall assembly
VKKTAQHSTPVVPRKYHYLSLFLFLLSIIIFSLMVAVTLAISLFYHTYLYHFKKEAHLSDREIIQTIKTGLRTPVFQAEHHKNILVLGIDELANREGDPVLTDTIMVLSLDTDSGALRSLSLPRDLWSVEYKTKINALYEYGKTRYPGHPEQFPTEVVSQMTGIPIQNTLVISLDQLKTLIDIVGGVKVEVPESFVDEQFPRSDVDIRTEHDPAKLYMKVEFIQGEELMTGERALQFIRSRHSSNLDQGTDDARTIRQQLVIAALLKEFKEPKFIKNPDVLGKLYFWYHQNFDQVLSVEELISLANSLRSKLLKISLQPQSLSIQTQDQPGVIIHPPVTKYQQWVYEVKDIQQFQSEVKEKLEL